MRYAFNGRDISKFFFGQTMTQKAFRNDHCVLSYEIIFGWLKQTCTCKSYQALVQIILNQTFFKVLDVRLSSNCQIHCLFFLCQNKHLFKVVWYNYSQSRIFSLFTFPHGLFWRSILDVSFYKWITIKYTKL